MILFWAASTPLVWQKTLFKITQNSPSTSRKVNSVVKRSDRTVIIWITEETTQQKFLKHPHCVKSWATHMLEHYRKCSKTWFKAQNRKPMTEKLEYWNWSFTWEISSLAIHLTVSMIDVDYAVIDLAAVIHRVNCKTIPENGHILYCMVPLY